MDTAQTIAAIFFGLAVALDVFATFRLIRSFNYTTKQKVLQLLIVWLLPLVGAIFIVFAMNSPEPKPGGYAGSLASPDIAGTSLPVADPFPSENSDSGEHGHF